MFIKLMLINLLSVLSFSIVAAEVAADPAANKTSSKEEVYKLSYIEREPGTDEYEMTMLVSNRYIRIDEEGENSGFIIYDDKAKIIYSVSHHDQSILVINRHEYSEDDMPAKPTVEYLQLADAPLVSGKPVFNYRVFVNAVKSGEEETCLEVQLVEGLMPKVRNVLQNYQKVVSGQQVKMVNNVITEMQTACFYVDQIYNAGAYYEKGLPVQEWHSNERSKILIGYKKILIDSDKFNFPAGYRQFSMGSDLKTFIN